MQLLHDFLKDCQTRRRSKRTLETYKSNVGEFLEYFPDPENVDKNDLRHYLGYLQNKGLKDSTLKGYFSALSSFYDFLIYEEVAHTNPILPFRQRFLDKPTKNERRQLLTDHLNEGLHLTVSGNGLLITCMLWVQGMQQSR